MNQTLFVTAEVSRRIGVSIDRIIRAHRSGKLPEPSRAGHHRVYTAADVDTVRRYFFGAEMEDCAAGHREAEA